MVSFGGSEEDFDYTRSLAASKAEDWVNFTKTVEKLGLEWSAPEEPAHSRLDEWLLQLGRHPQASHQQPTPFFPEFMKN